MPFPGIGTQDGKSFCSKQMGPLQRQLQKGEYELFRHSPMFESDFVQISKRGDPIEIHNQEQIVTIGITTSSPVLLIPDILLLARPISLPKDHAWPHVTKLHCGHQVKYELSRLFPLCLVKISIHDVERQQLKFKLASGRTFYLQLCPESYKRKELFDSWTKMIQLLWPPSENKLETKKFDHIRSSPRSKPKAPFPQPTTMSMTAWSDLIITRNLMEDKVKRKVSKAKPFGEDPDSPLGAEEDTELVSPPPSQVWEGTETSEEELAGRSSSHRSHGNSPSLRRRSIKQNRSSRSKSRQRAATERERQVKEWDQALRAAIPARFPHPSPPARFIGPVATGGLSQCCSQEAAA
uniref:Uncharacterized protein n=1 Tax=Sphaerodactylus townsendi TaxID=933632 RepID=A0ACB8FTB2_9SAUR